MTLTWCEMRELNDNEGKMESNPEPKIVIICNNNNEMLYGVRCAMASSEKFVFVINHQIGIETICGTFENSMLTFFEAYGFFMGIYPL